MVIRTLMDVATSKERRVLKNVRWGRVLHKAPEATDRHDAVGTHGKSGQGAVITGLWRSGCALVTQQNLLRGESIWIRAKDELGRPLLALVGVVTWNDNRYCRDGFRSEITFAEG